MCNVGNKSSVVENVERSTRFECIDIDNLKYAPKIPY
jgi:hypothetical protein